MKRYRGFDFGQFAVELARQRLSDAESRVADARTASSRLSLRRESAIFLLDSVMPGPASR